MSNQSFLTLMDHFRVALPGAPDEAIKLALFNTADDIAREAFRATPATDPDSDPDTWLTTAQWGTAYQALLHGTLARMFAEVSRPWTNPDLAKAHDTLYTTYLDLTRSEVTPTTAYDRLLAAVRVQVPFARDAGIKLEIYAAVNKVRHDALQEDPLDGTSDDPTTWLTTTQWGTAYQALLHGTLVGLCGQTGKPWSNPAVVALHQPLFNEELDELRSITSLTGATDSYTRLLAALRVQAPFVQDEAIQLELFNTVNKVRREALNTTNLAGTETPTNYLTAAQWTQCYQAVFEGTLARLFAQTSKPWANLDAAKAHEAAFLGELDLLRGEVSSAPDSAVTRLMDVLRVRLIGARDEILKMEMFGAMEEFFRTTSVWKELITLTISADDVTAFAETVVVPYTDFSIDPEVTATVIRINWMKNSSGFSVNASLPVPGCLRVFQYPLVADTYTIEAVLTLREPTDADDFPRYPSWLLTKYLDAIQDGTLGRMMSQQGKPYSSDRLSVYHLRRFRDAMAQAKVDERHQNLGAGQRWCFPRGWR